MGNQLGEKEEFVDKQKEVEAVCSPIVTKLYQGAGGAPGGMPGAGSGASGKGDGPTIEEVDLNWTSIERRLLSISWKKITQSPFPSAGHSLILKLPSGRHSSDTIMKECKQQMRIKDGNKRESH